MMGGMYAAISGLDANQTMLNGTANDLANVNTVGYKSRGSRSPIRSPKCCAERRERLRPTAARTRCRSGSACRSRPTDNEMSEGSFQSTNNPLDVAIQGEGFLRVGAGSPPAAPPYTAALPANVDYTRAGNLSTNTKGFLTTQAGLYVVGDEAVATVTEAGTTYAPGANETYIVIPPGSANVSIGQDGAVSYTDENPTSPTYQEQVTAGYLTLAQFPNQAGLERLGGSLWAQTSNSGAPLVGTPDTGGFGQTIGGELEMSNVDLATEMTQMITAERGYQANSRVITTANEMLQTVVSMVQ